MDKLWITAGKIGGKIMDGLLLIFKNQTYPQNLGRQKSLGGLWLSQKLSYPHSPA